MLPFYKILNVFKNPDVGNVAVVFTNGAGNNIFQYIYARLLADHYGLNLSCDGLDILDVTKTHYRKNKKLKTIKIGLEETDFQQYFNIKEPCNFIVHTYPEDYRVYKPHLEKIRSWFDEVPKTNEEDLVFHLRLGDRLLYKSSYEASMKVEAEEFVEAFEMFDFKRLHIVTDMNVWHRVTPKDVEKMVFHINVPDNLKVDSRVSAEYFNSLYDAFSKFDPIVRIGNSVKDDFNYMRSFDKIMFQHGTLSWWAAALSKASKVGFFAPWRCNKRNMGQTDFDGWFGWGTNRIKS